MKTYLQKEAIWEPTNFQTIQLYFYLWFNFIYKLKLEYTADPWAAIYEVKWKNLERRHI